MDWEFNGVLRRECAVVFRVREQFGGLSNMANDFPLVVGQETLKSSEALYQACRYPHRPEWQREIMNAPHAMRAKMAAKRDGRRNDSRTDWDTVRVTVMRWCLRVKLENNFGEFFNLLKSTDERPIVERSRRDRFWGAVLEKDGVLRGQNTLGKLLVELRNEVVAWMCAPDDAEEWPGVTAPRIPTFCLCDCPL